MEKKMHQKEICSPEKEQSVKYVKKAGEVYAEHNGELYKVMTEYVWKSKASNTLKGVDPETVVNLRYCEAIRKEMEKSRQTMAAKPGKAGKKETGERR